MKTAETARRTRFTALWAAVALLVLGPAGAAMQGGAPRVSIQDLKKMMDAGEAVTIVDTQPGDVYRAGHIRGAISIPWKPQIALEDVWSIPGDVPIVTYCDCGPGEADSSDVAAQLLRMGYADVQVLEHPSIEGWKAAGYPVESD